MKLLQLMGQYIGINNMGKQVTTILNRFDGGMTGNLRNSYSSISGNTLIARPDCQLSKHFDIVSTLNKLSPHLAQDDDSFNSNLSATQDTLLLCKFLSAGATSKQYALGDSSGNPRIFIRDSLPTGQWSGSSAFNGTTYNQRLFVEYQGVIWIAQNGTHFASYTISGAGVNNTAQAVTYTDVFQGLVGSDDIMYIPYYNATASYIATKDGATWNLTALTLPVDSIPVAICEYGNYLAIATKPRYIGGRSFIYLWDRDSASWSERIPFGSEYLEAIEEVEGYIVGVGISGTTASVIASKSKIIVRYATSGMLGAKKIVEIPTTNISTYIADKQKINNRMYFMMTAEIDGVRQAGIWSICRNADGGFAISIDRSWDHDTAFTASDLPKGFQLLGDYMTISYTIAGTYNIRVTKDATTYPTSAQANLSTFETLKFNAGNSSLKKDLLGITVATEPLPTAGSYSVYYRTDQNTSWTLIFTESTDNSISHSAINIESSGVPLPKDYKEIQFQIIPTGNAAITGLEFIEEITGKRIYG